MIGCILTGHGSFASGLGNALEMIAGPQENFKVVCFYEEKSLTEFSNQIHDVIEEMRQKSSGVVVFVDLLGGTPFRTAMIEAQDLDDVEVITGVNLPLLLESMMQRYATDSLSDFIVTALQSGKEGLQHVQLSQEVAEETIDEEGI